MKDSTKYNLFIFLSVLATGISEIYIPIFLYDQGFNIKLIFLFFLIKFSLVLVFYYPLIIIARKIKFKWLLVSSAFFLGISFYLLSIINNSILSIFYLALMFAFFVITYWAGRHYFALYILPKQNMANQVGYIVIATQLALIPSAYLGALIIENFGLTILTIIITIIALISIIPLLSIKEDINIKPFNIKQTINKIPKKNILLIGMDQARQLAVIFFPLFIYLNVVQTYRYVGIVNVAVGIAAMIFVYLFAKKIERDGKDYLSLAILLLGSVLLIKLNALTAIFMIVVAVFEGLTSRLHMTSIMKNIYSLGQNYYIPTYLIIYEYTLNIVKVIILIIAVLFLENVTIFLYLCVFIFLVSSCFQFKDSSNIKRDK